jgi:hypothetical protein
MRLTIYPGFFLFPLIVLLVASKVNGVQQESVNQLVEPDISPHGDACTARGRPVEACKQERKLSPQIHFLLPAVANNNTAGSALPSGSMAG